MPIRPRLYRWGKTTALVFAGYAGLSGPLAGAISHLPWIDPDTRFTLLFGHMIFYFPLMLVTNWIGLGSWLFAYWSLCGWINPIPFPA